MAALYSISSGVALRVDINQLERSELVALRTDIRTVSDSADSRGTLLMTGNQELNQNSENLSHLQDSATEQSATEQVVSFTARPREFYLSLLENLRFRCGARIRMGVATIVTQPGCASPAAASPTFLGEGWLASVHPDDRAGLAQILKEASQNQSSWETQYRLRHR
jgi:hypothetical protein